MWPVAPANMVASMAGAALREIVKGASRERLRRWPLPAAPQFLGAPRGRCDVAMLADAVDQAHAPICERLGLPELEPAARLRRRKQGPALTGNQRIDDEPQLIDQPGIDEARRGSRPADQIHVLAGLPLEGSNVINATHKARVWPQRRI